jgi:hypothetical protein
MTTQELNYLIDHAVNPVGGDPKIKGPALNTLLKSLVADLNEDGPKADLVNGLVPSSQLPSYVLEFANIASLPATGKAGKIYVVLDTNKQYRWSDSGYVVLSDSDLSADQIEQSLISNSTTTVPSVAAVKTAINTANNHAADIVNASKSRKLYADVKDAVVESVAGDTINLYVPIAIVPTQDIEAYFYLKGDVNLNFYGVKIVSPDTRHDIITFGGSSNVINGFNSTLTQLATGEPGSWFIGTYGGVTANATIHNLNLDIVTFNSVGFALYGNGVYNYSGNINSSGKYVVKLAPPIGTISNFTGTGNIIKNGTGNIFWLTANLSCNLIWSGNITANDTTTIKNGGGILTLREGVLHATNRPAGSELVFTSESADSVLVLENYSVLGVPGTTVINASKVILRGNTTIVGNIVSANIVDERPNSGNNHYADVLEFNAYGQLPATGESGKIYVTTDTGKQYRWGGSGYALLSDSGLTTDQLAAMQGAHAPNATNVYATMADVPPAADVKAIRVVAATRQREVYSGIGTSANPRQDGLVQALAAAQAGDTVIQVTNAAITGMLTDTEQVLLKPGVNYDTAGFDIYSTGGGDAITLPNSGSGKINGNNSVVYVGARGWGLGWYLGPGPKYRVYDLHFETVDGACCVGFFSQGDIYHSGNINLVNGGRGMQMSDWHAQPGFVRNYEHVGDITIGGSGIGLEAFRQNAANGFNKVTQRGNMRNTSADARLATLANETLLSVIGGTLDISVGRGISLDATSTVILQDVTVIGAVPVYPASGAQAAGGTVRLRGETTLPIGTAWDPLLTIIDERTSSAKADLVNDKVPAAQLPYLGFTPMSIQSVVANGTFNQGELLSASPADSIPGMKFSAGNGTTNYVYEYMNSSADANGTQFTWVRYMRS